MSRLRVGVVRGGPSSEYDISLQTGSAILKNLSPEYLPSDILITKDGTWHLGGLPVAPESLKGRVDVVFNALHGEYGEDGQIQQFFDSLGIPYTGSGHFGSALAINKNLAKEVAQRHGLKTPSFLVLSPYFDTHELALNVFQKIAPPWVLKPINKGSSLRVLVAYNFDDLLNKLTEILRQEDKVLVEEYIFGREASVGVMDQFRNQVCYVLPPVEIRLDTNKKIFDYETKYQVFNNRTCPGCFSEIEKASLVDQAQKIHQALGLKHYSRSDFIVSKRGTFFLETNSLPDLSDSSLMGESLKAIGLKIPQFIDHIIKLTLK